MPVEQREYLIDLKKKVKLREMINFSRDFEIRDSYNKAVQALTEFRTDHIKIVSRYMVVVQSKISQTDNQNYREHDVDGTAIMSLLKTIRDNTQKHIFSD